MQKLVWILVLFLFAACTNNKVDTIVHQGVIYTVDSAYTVAEAMALKDGKIVAVGSNANIQQNYTAKENIDAKGQAVYPGFIDAHAHFVGYGKSLYQVDLFGTATWQDRSRCNRPGARRRKTRRDLQRPVRARSREVRPRGNYPWHLRET